MIDPTYFVSPIDIPNLTTEIGGVTDTSNLAALTRAISIYQAEFMRLLLGDLYPDFVSDKDGKWDDLKAKLVDSDLKVSPIANYVFFKYYPQLTTPNTGVGVAYNKTENQGIDNRKRLTDVWNDMVLYLERCDGVMDYLYDNRADLETDVSLPDYLFFPYKDSPFRPISLL
jgi:hypothetical protein